MGELFPATHRQLAVRSSLPQATTQMSYVLTAQMLHGPDRWLRLSQQVMIRDFPNAVKELLKVVIASLARLLTSSKGLA